MKQILCITNYIYIDFNPDKEDRFEIVVCIKTSVNIASRSYGFCKFRELHSKPGNEIQFCSQTKFTSQKLTNKFCDIDFKSCFLIYSLKDIFKLFIQYYSKNKRKLWEKLYHWLVESVYFFKIFLKPFPKVPFLFRIW